MNQQDCKIAQEKLIKEQASLEANIKATEESIKSIAAELGIEPTQEAFAAKSKELESKLAALNDDLIKAINEYKSIDGAAD